MRLARRLAEAEGGRLRRVATTIGVTFELVLPVPPSTDQKNDLAAAGLVPTV